jgi:hypothetical protein
MTIRARTAVGIGRETAWGTAPSTLYTVPVNPPSFTDTYEQILDQGLRGIAAKDFSSSQGAGVSEASLEGVGYPEEIGWFLYGIAGTISTSGTAAPYTHTFSLDASPPSFTIEDQPHVTPPGGSDENKAYQYKGSYCNSLTLRFSAAEGALSWTAGFRGLPSGGTVSPTSLIAETANAPFLGYYGQVSLGGDSFARLVDCEWTFSREVVMQHTAQNTQNPVFGYSGELEVTIRATMEFHADEDLARYRNNTQPAFSVTFTRGSGASQKTLIINCPSISFLEGAPEIDRSAVNVRLTMTARALYDSGISGPVEFTLTNAQASY